MGGKQKMVLGAGIGVLLLSAIVVGAIFFFGSKKNEETFVKTETEGTTGETKETKETAETASTTLKQAFAENGIPLAGVCIPNAALSDQARMNLVFEQFNAVTLENETKPESILGSTPSSADNELGLALHFESADAVFDKLLEHNAGCDEANQIKVRGHVLVWHSQTPTWFFRENYDSNADYVTPEVMSQRMESYIKLVFDHYFNENSPYKDLFYGWDVVNEAVNDGSGGMRSNGSDWYQIYKSDEFVIKAFQYANKYAPESVKLFYNDYNDSVPVKRNGICKLITAIKEAEGTRIDGMGMQGHDDMYLPSLEDREQAVRAYAALVDEIQITEFDMKASSGYDGSNPEEEYQKQAERYQAIYDKLVELNSEEGIHITGITFWGTDDGHSWLQTFNGAGGGADGSQKQCPLLFDAEYQPKPTYYVFTGSDEKVTLE